ncbi:MAG: response regulator [Campylobacterota bacterium]|nr:response regulator [Campylobacterota bacterium]
MLNILLVDSNVLHNKIVRNDSTEYLKKIGMDYSYFEADNCSDAIEIMENNKIDLAYINIASKQLNGLSLLEQLKSLNIVLPQIIGVTNLNDTEFRFKALKLGVYKYIYQPYDNKEIEYSLENFLEAYKVKKEEQKESADSDLQQEDEFMDFDDDSEEFMDFDDDSDEFMDFDSEEDKNGIEHSKELMDAFNDSHKKVSASEFLEEYSEDAFDTEDLLDLEEELDSLIAYLLFESKIEEKLDDIVYLLEKYNRFLYRFTEFEELSKVLYGLVELLKAADFSKVQRKEMVSKFIVAIIDDLVNWKEHVFVLQDAVDVYYINASILNSFVQLKDLLEN